MFGVDAVDLGAELVVQERQLAELVTAWPSGDAPVAG
jgi:hypothetical protein